MTVLEHWIQTPLVNALGWTLFHFVWQGASIAFLVAAILLIWRPASARVRYGLACLAMAAMPAAFGLTLIRCMPPHVEVPAPLATTGPAIASRQTSAGPESYPHSQIRLPGQPAPDMFGISAVLSSGGLVGSSLMRTEREYCYDDIVVAASGNPREYVLTPSL